MKRVSDKRRKLLAEVGPWRKALRVRVGRCECGCMKATAPENLDVDEIARGSGHRPKALDKSYAVLCVRRDHHRIIQPWSRAKRLALLYIHRPSDFDLEKWYALIQRRWPSWEEISRWVDILTVLPKGENVKIAGAGVEAPASLNTLSCKGAKHVSSRFYLRVRGKATAEND